MLQTDLELVQQRSCSVSPEKAVYKLSERKWQLYLGTNTAAQQIPAQ